VAAVRGVVTARRKPLRRAANEAAYLPNITIGHDVWVYGYHPETEQTPS